MFHKFASILIKLDSFGINFLLEFSQIKTAREFLAVFVVGTQTVFTLLCCKDELDSALSPPPGNRRQILRL